MSCFDLTHAPVATTARAAATGPASMSTWPDPEGLAEALWTFTLQQVYIGTRLAPFKTEPFARSTWIQHYAAGK